jgi:hypothetical protein
MKIACPEEIAFEHGCINADDLLRLARKLESSKARKLGNASYGTYLKMIAQDA